MKYSFVFLFCLFILSSCYYDNEQDLYPVTACDTTDISFNADILPIFQNNCAVSGCHAGQFPANGYDFSSYDEVSFVAEDQVLGSITFDPNYSPMPKNSGQLSDCNIRQIQLWYAAGKPNN
jgi:hypothetical protein